MLRAKHVAVVANGSINAYESFVEILKLADVIIAADGGLKHLEKMNVAPSLIIGDFDSIDSLAYYEKLFPMAEVRAFEVRKDYTDSELAVRIALDYQPETVTLIGVTGTRLDHTFGNLSLLKILYEAGVEGVIIDDHNQIRYIETELTLKAEIGTNMSIVPLSDNVTGITLEGFEYPLNDATLEFGSSTGISNVFAKTTGRIVIKAGRAFVLQSRD